uniref:Uncharacterized protein n=1 Tax=Aegilops tauschii subsp. strangulata TaxID=200361 RepID=A0A453H727_AEGTS
MGRLGDKSDYESIREARISENMARMEMLGLRRCAGELSAISSAPSPRAGSVTPRKTPKPPRVLTPLRRSGRLIAAATPPGSGSRRSARLNGDSVQHKALPYRGTGTEFLLSSRRSGRRGRGAGGEVSHVHRQGEAAGAAGDAVRQQGEGVRVRPRSWDLLPFLQAEETLRRGGLQALWGRRLWAAMHRKDGVLLLPFFERDPLPCLP